MVPFAPVFDIQSFSTHDGPGIRTVVFLKGCPLCCTWCSNPEGQIPGMQMRRRLSLCRMCLTCAEACAGANPGEIHGQMVINFEPYRCSHCGARKCLDACPTGALEVVGRKMDAAGLVAELKKDIRFFWNSGGGITFSGGEPLLYPEFIIWVAGKMASYSVPCAIETCGYWEWKEVAGAVDSCSIVFFDLKSIDEEKHQSFTGKPVGRILRNLESLSDRCPDKIVVSIPIIPGFNDTPDEIVQLADRIQKMGLRKVRLLPYHNFSSTKYLQLGMNYPHAPWDRPLGRDFLFKAMEIMASAGLACPED